MKKLYFKKFNESEKNGSIRNLATLELDEREIYSEEELKEQKEKRALYVSIPKEVQQTQGVQENQNIGDFEDNATTVQCGMWEENKYTQEGKGEEQVTYRIFRELPKEKDYQGREKIISIGGFVEIAGKESKKSRVKRGNKGLMANILGDIPVLRELPKHYKIVGYVKLAGKDTYIALIKRKLPLLILLFPFLAACIAAVVLISTSPNIKSPIDIDIFDNLIPKGQGEIEIEEQHLPDVQSQRLIINTSVTLTDVENENGNIEKMLNIMIENREESNIFSEVAEIYLLSKIDEQGNIIEDYGTGKKIAETPLLHPGENIEWLPINSGVEVELGKYDARALFTVYYVKDGQATQIGQLAGRLSLIAN